MKNEKLTFYCSLEREELFRNEHCKSYESYDTLKCDIIKNGFVIPIKEANKKLNNILNEIPALYGGVVDENFNFVKTSLVENILNKNIGGDFIGIDDNDKNSNFNIIDETVIYIGDWRYHPVHFYLDNLSRFWILLKNKEYKKLKFVYIDRCDKPISEFALFFFECFDIAPEQIIKIDKITKFKGIIIPEQAFKLNQSYHRAFLDVISFVQGKVTPANIKKLYFSKMPGRFIGEELAVKIFKKNGFKVVIPELLTMREKISLLLGCEEFVAQSGSNAHNSLWLNPNAKLTILNRDEYLHPVQTQINQLKEINVTYIDSFCNFLPVWFSMGPFMFNYNSYMKKYLTENNMKTIDDLSRKKERKKERKKDYL